MCGIFGYVGKSGHAASIALEGLKKLEYRGYDSAGLALIDDMGKLHCAKCVGKVEVLAEKAQSLLSLESSLSIAHTRWATHGVPSELNAHPHVDSKGTMAMVHNGIIENHRQLRLLLSEKGVLFRSETDTEVALELLALLYKEHGHLLSAIKELLILLEGSFAIVVIHSDYPSQLFAFARHAPLAIGIGSTENYIASDPHAFSPYAKDVIFLGNGEIARLFAEKSELYSSSLESIDRSRQTFEADLHRATKEGYEHFTLKEICEQPMTVRSALTGRIVEEYGNAFFSKENDFDLQKLHHVERVLFLACGTSWHAALLGCYLIEELARIPSQAEIASEFRYKNPIVSPNTLVIAISQSGETADTIAAMREVQAKEVEVLALCNVENSTLAREAQNCLFLRAGAEVGVCSTKAFTSQVTLLVLLALSLGRMRHLSKEEGQELIFALKHLPHKLEEVINRRDEIAVLAAKYSHYHNFFFVGRRYMYPTCLEGALKLKEISYINANAYAAGEMKHGPIALIDSQCPTVALCANNQTFNKLLSNLMEIKARQGPLLAIATEEQAESLFGVADDLFVVPALPDLLAPLATAVVLQLFAYEVALQRGTDIDQPRNLAKSVTVE